MAALRLERVGKRYRKLDEVPTLVGRALRVGRTRKEDFWALRDVSLDVTAGERVGVIGRNGAGKSTMLRIVAGVTAPSTGSVTVRGRVAPLLSVGVGFHPELTGRENIYINGAVLGLSSTEIARRFDEMVDFAGIERFLDTPVKFYSSGMFVRLGFAVAIVATPDILIVDEVLAVGDVSFQQRCFERMRQVADDGTTVVVVSHNLAGIRQLCPRTVLLHQGSIVMDASTESAITTYYGLLGEAATAADEAPVRVKRLSVEGVAQPVPSGADATLRIELHAVRDVGPFRLWLGIGTVGLAPVYTEMLEGGDGLTAGSDATVDVNLRLPLAEGDYVVQVAIRDPDRRTRLGRGGPLPFHVTGRASVSGLVDLDARFSAVAP